jgi:hypothetical protein
MDQTVFMIGFAVMSLASLAIYAKGSKAPHHVTTRFFTQPCLSSQPRPISL